MQLHFCTIAKSTEATVRQLCITTHHRPHWSACVLTAIPSTDITA